MMTPSSEELLALENQQRDIYDRARFKSRHQVGNALTAHAALCTAHADLGRARGRRAPGIDGMVYAELEPELDAISHIMRTRTYRPAPLKLVSIPKASGGTRQLGIPTICDRFAQRLLLLFIAPVVERVLPLTSFACRVGFGAGDALKALELDLLRDGEDMYFVRADIKDFFHNIRHQMLRSRLRQYLRGGEFWNVLDGQLSTWRTARGRGLPQGAPASPALANFYLSGVDHAFTYSLPDGVVYLRYLDDIVMVVRGGRARAEQALDELRRELHALGLRLNHKSLIARADQGIGFLGLHFRRVGDKVDVRVDDEALIELKSRIDEHAVDLDRGAPEETPDIEQRQFSQQTILEETIPKQTHFEQTSSRRETPELDWAVMGFTNYYSPHDPRVLEEVCWYYFQRTGRWLDHGSGRDKPSRRGVPAWMLRLPGDRYRIDREGGDRDTSGEGVDRDTWLRPTGVAPRSLVGLAAKPTEVHGADAPTFLELMGLRDEPGDDEIRGLRDLDLGDSMRRSAGARRWLGAALGKVQQAISETRTRRKAMRATAARSLEDEGYIQRSLVDAALDQSPVYREALEEGHRLALSVQRLCGEMGRADIFNARLQTEMGRRRQGLIVRSEVRGAVYRGASGMSSARVDAERCPSVVPVASRGLCVRNLSSMLTNPANTPANVSFGSTLTPLALILTTIDQRPGMSLTELLQHPEITGRGWSQVQMAEYLEQMVRGELLDARRVNGGPTALFPA